ncbi:MAG: diguanylate cyclase [Gammaproteobacteria bacterium]|nr:diguanylate cyclase [Gammaproteobacteria bacterium]
MDKAKELLFKRLQALRNNYIDDYPERVLELNMSWRELSKDRTNEDILETFHRQAHSLKGSGATFGFNDISTLASQLDAILGSLSTNKQEPGIDEDKQITILIEKLGAINLKREAQSEPGATTKKEEYPDTNLLMVMSNKKETENLNQQLNHFGYNITSIHTVDGLAENITRLEPAAIIMEADFNGDQQSGVDAITSIIKDDQTNFPPVIYIAENDDISTRINAVRNAGKHFLSRPLNVSDLSDIVEVISRKDQDEPFRIMIVEDTKSLSTFYDITLQSAGMKTCVINNPMQVLEQLIDFNPELILMDMYMPGCSGPELATVIRQFEAYVSIPIVFLSSELDTGKQLLAMQQGGDDFLTKPIDPSHLITSVQTRSLRYRKLRAFMVRDSLTGLYNHTKTKELLDKDLYRTERNNGNLVFAIIDIDKFKLVNDKYGHPVGDKVIKSLALMLKQRLRKSDTVGRYGGEEFAVILYDTDINNALQVMNKIRDSYASIVHKAGDIEFNVTFSCGLAAYPYFKASAELNEAADKALYEAKESGRNKVIVASSKQS